MPYVSKADRERAQHSEQWTTLAEAVTHVLSRDGCSRAKALKQLREALADRRIPVKWQDADAQGTCAPDAAAREKLSPEDKGKLAEFRAKWKAQISELRGKGYMDSGITEVITFAYRNGITPALAAAVLDITHPLPSPISHGAPKLPTIDYASILRVPVFWRERRYRGGKVLDLIFDRWRVPLLERASVLREWPTDQPDGTPTPGREVSDRDGATVISISAARDARHPGGRPSAKDQIFQTLDRLLEEEHPVRTMAATTLAKLVAKRCQKTLDDKGWHQRTVLEHIHDWRSCHPA